MNDLVSILIPCYNHAAFLDDILTSILDQDYPNIELLVCDDCSPDQSYQLLLSYRERLCQKLTRVELLQNQTNQGITRNLNRLLALAQGEYIKIIASDDAMTADAISTMVSFLQDHPEYDVAVCNGVKVSEDQHYPNFKPLSRVYEQAPDFRPEGFPLRIAQCNEIFAPGAIVRRSVYAAHGVYDESIPVEDLEYWLRLTRSGKVLFGYIPKELIYYRVTSNSMSSTVSTQDLSRRRQYFFDAVSKTLEKHRDGFTPEFFCRLMLTRILNERYFAISHGLTQWEFALQNTWRQFMRQNKLPLGQRLLYEAKAVKCTVKKMGITGGIHV